MSFGCVEEQSSSLQNQQLLSVTEGITEKSQEVGGEGKNGWFQLKKKKKKSNPSPGSEEIGKEI